MRNRELNGSFMILILLAALILGKAEIYIVTLEGEPVIIYKGRVSGFEATAVHSDSDEKIDVISLSVSESKPCFWCDAFFKGDDDLGKDALLLPSKRIRRSPEVGGHNILYENGIY